ncbi:hypothetical protein FF011L_20210 [Roseimaritima multifibrata]|uniref:Uncharacterized protein n=1 Tax=Roseimaritima multifibrata TaxID=1930274 RepID=A0A517MEE8_9BACT|nr:hypothetical protein [Roseimaritima multifibrata]QDS93259.1 hypothetical protein FF011L_20210 [Roseimaritima multifibrata]
MKLRLRVWLAGMAICLLPSLAHAQHFLNQCSAHPILVSSGLTADQAIAPTAITLVSNTSNSSTPAAATDSSAPSDLPGIRYCTPEAEAAPASSKAAPAKAELKAKAKAKAAKQAAAKAEAKAAKQAAEKAEAEAAKQAAANAEAAALFAAVTEESARLAIEAAEVEAAESAALDAALAIALERLAIEEPIDVPPLRDEAAEASPVAVATKAPMKKAPLNDSPVICTLRAPEEYLPYDLTAADALRWQVFAGGIPVPQRRLRIPNQPAATDSIVHNESSLHALYGPGEEPLASVVPPKPSVVATAAEPQGPMIPMDCLLDELVWQVSGALAEEGWLRENLQAESIGTQLPGLVFAARHQASEILVQIGQQFPVAPAIVGPPAAPQALAVALEIPAQVGPPQIIPDSVVIVSPYMPSVCCPIQNEADERVDCEAEPAGRLADNVESTDSRYDDGFDFEENFLAKLDRQDDDALTQATPQPSKEEIDANLQEVLDLVRSLANPFRNRIADGANETDTIQR